jgi:nicotinamidase-related amidase
MGAEILMTLKQCVTVTVASLMLACAVKAQKKERTMNLKLRTRVELFKGSGQWEEVALQKEFAPQETAMLICDVWDKHWCQSATQRCSAIARKIATLVEAARAKGVFIIHAPSDTMEFYKDTPQRKRMMDAPPIEPPAPLQITEPPLPIDDSDGGCDDAPPCKTHKAWVRQNPVIRVADEDGVSDKGAEVYNALRQRGIKTLFIMGVHTNMCVLGRSFAIRQMTRWGVPCVLVRDLTDTMYNPRKRPFVSHDEGTRLVVEHIEKYLGPTLTSQDLITVLGGQ